MWLPFDPDDLGEIPSSLRYEHVDADDLPESGDEVELYVLPYRFRPADGEVLARLPRLRTVQTMSAGVEHIRASFLTAYSCATVGGSTTPRPRSWPWR